MAEGFRQKVYALVRRIPSGKVLGYGDVAVAIGHPGAARQVGYALAALQRGHDVPWQRVLRSTGHIAMQGDLTRGPLQRRLLEEAGVEFQHERVPMETYRWAPELF